MVTSVMAPAALAAAPDGSSAEGSLEGVTDDEAPVSAEAVGSSAVTGLGDTGAGSAIEAADGSDVDDADNVDITLVTGQTVTVVDGDDERTIITDSDEPLHQVETPSGTYVFPDGVDFSVYDRDLFNVDLLMEENLTDGEADEIPVIVRMSEVRNGETVGAADASALDGVSGVSEARHLSLIDANAATLEKERAGVAFDRLDRDPDRELEAVYLDRTVEVSLDTSVEAIAGEQARAEHDVNGTNVTVAVLDTGVDAEHPDLEGAVVHQTDFSGDGVGDRAGHGTHVAGTIAGDGSASNGTYVGVAPGADVLDVKVLGDDGYGQTSDIVDGIDYAVDRDADVISMSLGGSGDSNDPLVDAADRAVESGVVVVSAAGNSGPERGTVGSPAIAERGIAVGASDHRKDTLADFSSRGPTADRGLVKPDVVAPGVEIAAARADGAYEPLPENDAYARISGTSMATPHVSGVVALMLEQDPDASPERAKNVLLSTTDGPVGTEETDVFSQGAGQVNATAAVSPSLVVTNATESYGVVEQNETIRRTITIENPTDEPVDLRVEERLVEVTESESHADNLTVNESNVTVPAGETVTLAYEVDVDEDGVFSGEVLFRDERTGETVRSIFGFTAGTEVTVEKRAYSDDGTVDDDFVWASAVDASHDEFVTLDENGQATFLATAEEYTVWSSGVDEPTHSTIHLFERLNTSRQASITLDERDTVDYAVDDTELDAELRTMQAENKLQFERDDRRWGMRSRYDGLDVAAVRFSSSDELNASIHHVAVPESQHDTGHNVDVDDVYWLVYATEGVDADRNFVVNESELGTFDRTYHRSGDGETVRTAFLSLNTVWDDRGSGSVGWDVGDRTSQRIHVTQNAEYNPIVDVSDGYTMPLGHFLTPPAGGETVRTTANARPLTGWLDTFEVSGARVDVGGVAMASQDDPKRMFLPWNGDSAYEVRVNDDVVDAGGGHPEFYSANDVDLEAGDDVRVGVEAVNHEGVLSDYSTTEANVTYDPDGDNTPPIVEQIEVAGADEYTSVDPGNVTIRLAVESSDGIDENELYLLTATEDVDDAPWDGDELNPAGTWDEWDLTIAEQDLGTYVLEATVDASDYEGTLDLAVSLRDVGGDAFRSGTTNAFHVGDPPAVENDDGTVETEVVTGQLLDADGEPAANDTVFVSQRESGHWLYDFVRTNETGHFEVLVEDGYTYDLVYTAGNDGNDWSDVTPHDGTVDYVSIASVNLTDQNTTVAVESTTVDDADIEGLEPSWGSSEAADSPLIETSDPALGEIDLPVGHQVTATVVDEQGDPVGNATVTFLDEGKMVDDEEFLGVGWAIPTSDDGQPYFPSSQVEPGPDDDPGMEMNGTATILVAPPEDDERFVDREYEFELDVNESVNISVELEETESIEVTGQIDGADGQNPANSTIITWEDRPVNGPGEVIASNVLTEEGGSFAFELDGNARNYTVVYYDGNWHDEDEALFRQNGLPDVYAFDRFDTDEVDEVVDYGVVDLPEAHDLNVSVVDEDGNPVEDVNVSIEHVNADNGATSGIYFPEGTNEDGFLFNETWERDDPGIEAAGDVVVTVESPDDERFVDREYTRNVTVDGDTNVTVTLEGEDETADTVFEVAPDDDTVLEGETVEVDVRVDTTDDLTATDFVLDYDPELFDVEDVEVGDFLSQDGAETLNDTSVDRENGTIDVAESRQVESGVAGEGVLATVTLRAVEGLDAEQDAALAFETADAVDDVEQNVPVETRDAGVTVRPSESLEVDVGVETPVHVEQNVTVIVDADPGSENVSDLHLELPASAEEVDRERIDDTTWAVTIVFDESTWEGDENGTYERATVHAVVEDEAGNSAADEDTTQVRTAGDVTGDGEVQLLDLRLLALAYGSEAADDEYDPMADLTNDGEVGLQDLTVLSQAWRSVAWDDASTSESLDSTVADSVVAARDATDESGFDAADDRGFDAAGDLGFDDSTQLVTGGA